MNATCCPYCDSPDRTDGYGYAAGPLGSYTFCDRCDRLIAFTHDVYGCEEDEMKRGQERDLQCAKEIADAAAKFRATKAAP